VTAPKIQDLARKIEDQGRMIDAQGQAIDILAAETTALRMLLAASGIHAEPSLLDDGWITLKRYAAMSGVSPGTVHSRIRRQGLEKKGQARKLGHRWVLKMHKCTG
jgi:hypothetical protein